MPRFCLSVLGSFHSTLDQQPLDGYRSDKTRALLAYLALEAARPLRRPIVAALLWPGYPRLAALTSLRIALANLRQLLAPLPLIKTTPQTVEFNAHHPNFWCDALELDDLLRA